MKTLINTLAFSASIWSLNVGWCDAQVQMDPKSAFLANDLQSERRFANDGNPKAQLFLGEMYREGRIVAKDTQKATFWLSQAAALGDDGAQFGLGSMYERGDGVPQDYRLAATWYKKAADQNNYLARIYLSASTLRAGVFKRTICKRSGCWGLPPSKMEAI